MPPTLSLAEAERAVADLRAAQQPIEPRALGVLLARTLALWAPAANFDDVGGFYREALEASPPDIVEAALRQVRLEHRFETMPKPADFHRAAARLAAPRRRALALAELMLQRLQPRLPAPATPRQGRPAPAIAPKRVTGLDAPDSDVINLGDTAARLALWAKHGELHATEPGSRPMVEDDL